VQPPPPGEREVKFVKTFLFRGGGRGEREAFEGVSNNFVWGSLYIEVDD